jgi:outer membrane lipase/esterase
VTKATADLATAAQVAAGVVDTLASEGAKTFIVPLQSGLGKKPFLSENGTTAALGTQLALSYNANLLADLNALIPSDGISVHFLNLFALTDAEVNDPAAFGYTDVTDPCYGGPLTGGGAVCANPNSFLWWDQDHGTEHANQAAQALNAIPEPDMLAGLLRRGCC